MKSSRALAQRIMLGGVLSAALLATAVALPAVASATSSAVVFNPANFGRDAIDNKWFPLTPGTTLVYKGTKDGRKATDIFHVSHRRRMIDGVSCVAVEDTLTLNGRIGEKTTDWYAQDVHGNVWYMGERTAEYDRLGNVVSTEGSWQAGVDGAEPGVFMPSHPHVGDTFRQEFFPGHAEDHFRVMSLDASVSAPYQSFTGTLRSREWTPLEPGVRDAKYYVAGIGEVKEVTVRGPLEELNLVQIIHG